MSDTDDRWSAAPVREPGHLPGPTDAQEARRTPDASAAGDPAGRVHGRPAPAYGEYAPEGWVNPVLAEQERLEREDCARAGQDRVATPAGRPAATTTGDRATGPAAARYGKSRRDFLLTVGLLVIGLWTVLESFDFTNFASRFRQLTEQRFTALSDPSVLSQAVVIRAFVLLVVFVLVMWWSVRRLRARRRTVWVPLVGGVVGSLLGFVPLVVVVLRDPAIVEYAHHLRGFIGG